MKRIAMAGFLLLTACVGGNLSSKAELEEYPLRGASTEEGKRLKRCLKAAHHFQLQHHKKTGSLYRRASDIPVDAYCQNLLLAQSSTKEGYEIMAQFHEDESTVRWTINQDGVIEEHLDQEFNDDVDFF